VDYYRRNSLQTIYKEVGTPLLFPYKETEKGYFHDIFGTRSTK